MNNNPINLLFCILRDKSRVGVCVCVGGGGVVRGGASEDIFVPHL